jgi:hypothetical protein
VRASVVGLGVAVLAAGCAAVLPVAQQPPPVEGPRISFTIPDGWSRLESTSAVHYLTSGDPAVCDGVVGSCDPSTYVMETGTIDAWVEPHTEEVECAETGTPTWDAGIEARANPIREATYRREWTVCYQDTVEAVRIIGELRTADMALRDRMLADLRTFVESLALIGSGVPGK